MSGTDFQKTSVKIPSLTKGWDLDAWKFLPSIKTSGTFPVIVMAHGFGANKLMSLQPYAEAFSSIGYACVVFDYRRWGASDGTPRSILIVKDQLDDYRTVIKWVRQQLEFDPQRVVLFGTSFSGGHVISLSAEHDLNIKAAISQCPYTGVTSPLAPSLGVFKTISYAVFDAIKLKMGLGPVYIPVGADAGEVGALAADGAKEGLLRLASNPSDNPNEVNASALFQIPPYNPISTASQITSPILLIPTEEDNLCLLQGAKDVVKSVQGDKGELVVAPGGHFEVYPGGAHHQLSIDSQLAFLRKHVPV